MQNRHFDAKLQPELPLNSFGNGEKEPAAKKKRASKKPASAKTMKRGAQRSRDGAAVN